MWDECCMRVRCAGFPERAAMKGNESVKPVTARANQLFLSLALTLPPKIRI